MNSGNLTIAGNHSLEISEDSVLRVFKIENGKKELVFRIGMYQHAPLEIPTPNSRRHAQKSFNLEPACS